jgi:hypothetical protein
MRTTRSFNVIGKSHSDPGSRDAHCWAPPAHRWTGRALQEEFSDGHAVRVNLSGLEWELGLRAIMGIRAQLTSLDPRPQGPCAGLRKTTPTAAFQVEAD